MWPMVGHDAAHPSLDYWEIACPAVGVVWSSAARPLTASCMSTWSVEWVVLP